MTKTIQLKKIGMGDIFSLENGGVKLKDKMQSLKIGDEIKLFDVYGMARGHGIATHAQYGDSTFLIGMFKVKCGDTTYTAPKCFFLEYLTSMIVAEMVDGVTDIQFAYSIRAVRNDSTIGYEFFGDSLIETGDPLEALEKQVAETMKIENKSKKK